LKNIFYYVLTFNSLTRLDFILGYIDVNTFHEDIRFSYHTSDEMLQELVKRGLTLDQAFIRRMILEDRLLCVRVIVERVGIDYKLYDQSLLWNAIARRKSKQIRKELIRLGGDINTTISTSTVICNCLTRACEDQDIDFARYLINSGIQTSGRAYEEAIIIAIESDNQELIDTVLDRWSSSKRDELREILGLISISRLGIEALFYDYANPQT